MRLTVQCVVELVRRVGAVDLEVGEGKELESNLDDR